VNPIVWPVLSMAGGLVLRFLSLEPGQRFSMFEAVMWGAFIFCMGEAGAAA
jgi:hypothetical protein